MTFFDDGILSLPWLQEKTLRALQDAVRFVDLANEPDTTDWYKKRLRELASPVVGRLVPIVAHLYQKGDEAAQGDATDAILKGGTFALARWAKRWKIVDPTKAAFEAFAPERTDHEIDEKGEAPPQGVVSIEETDALELRLEVCAAMARAMLHEELPEAARRMLAWFVWNLTRSSFADVVLVSKRFLPSDIGRTPEETAEGYRALYDARLIERVEELPELPKETLALRLIAEGANESKHPKSYCEETFGFPGATVGGKPTIGNELDVYPEGAAGKATVRWLAKAGELGALRNAMQAALGEDRAFVEGVRVGATNDGPVLHVRLRYPIEESDVLLRAELGAAVDEWIRHHSVRVT